MSAIAFVVSQSDAQVKRRRRRRKPDKGMPFCGGAAYSSMGLEAPQPTHRDPRRHAFAACIHILRQMRQKKPSAWSNKPSLAAPNPGGLRAFARFADAAFSALVRRPTAQTECAAVSILEHKSCAGRRGGPKRRAIGRRRRFAAFRAVCRGPGKGRK